MRKYRCPICGYTYNEAIGIPEKGIAPGTKWEDLPEDFACPWCGAVKLLFTEVKEMKTESEPLPQYAPVSEGLEEVGDLTAGELAAIFSNLAKGCDKQHLWEERDLFNTLSEYYTRKAAKENAGDFSEIVELLEKDLSESLAKATSAAKANADRGALRALVWSEKVSRIEKSLLERYVKEKDSMLENTKIYVCDICGFIYIGENPPEVCPVCRVPNFKILQVPRR